jgi:hypothetical protein
MTTADGASSRSVCRSQTGRLSRRRKRDPVRHIRTIPSGLHGATSGRSALTRGSGSTAALDEKRWLTVSETEKLLLQTGASDVPKWLPLVVLVAAVTVVAWAATEHGTPSSDVKKPVLNLRRPIQNQPGPDATALQLGAGGLTLCDPGKPPELKALTKRETNSEVILRSSVRVYDEENGCEEYDGGVDVNVRLDRPLANRQVVDESRGEHRVIWSPALRRMVVGALAWSAPDVEKRVLSAMPGTHSAKCFRIGVSAFTCSAKPADEKRQYFRVNISRTGMLSTGPENARTPTNLLQVG